MVPNKGPNMRMEERQIISANIKRLREAGGFTQDHVASFLGITRSSYSNYETGSREIPFPVMNQLSDLYGCDMFELYTEDNKVMESMLVTAFRVDNLTPDDMQQLAAFKRIVKNSLKMDALLAR